MKRYIEFASDSEYMEMFREELEERGRLNSDPSSFLGGEDA